jgi:hypothetical protein
MFPALRETMVSAYRLYAGEIIYLSYMYKAKENEYF